MCLIIYTTDGNIPKSHLKRGLIANPDGWGYMYVDKRGKMHVHKGMKSKDFWKSWREEMTNRQGNKLLFHSRIMTHGIKALSSCHPFRIGKQDLYMMHNGIISEHAEYNSEKSDTQLFIRDIVEGLPHNWLSNELFVRLVSGYIGFSKLAFMDGHGNVRILNTDQGEWSRKRWYSNDSFKPSVADKWGYNVKGEYIKVLPAKSGDDVGDFLEEQQSIKAVEADYRDEMRDYELEKLYENSPTPYVPFKYRAKQISGIKVG